MIGVIVEWFVLELSMIMLLVKWLEVVGFVMCICNFVDECEVWVWLIDVGWVCWVEIGCFGLLMVDCIGMMFVWLVVLNVEVLVFCCVLMGIWLVD